MREQSTVRFPRAVFMVLLGGIVTLSAPPPPTVCSIDDKVLREYTGVYQWKKDAFLYLQL